ncbi:hypothetical protein Tco_1228135, partial [Tanacetum coccineum]
MRYKDVNYAFLASQLQSAGLQTKLFRHAGIVDFGPTFDDALCVFNTSMETGLLSNPSDIVAPKLMKKLENIYISHGLLILHNPPFLTPRQMALWKYQLEDHTSNWLRAVLVSDLGYTMMGFCWDICVNHVVSCASIMVLNIVIMLWAIPLSTLLSVRDFSWTSIPEAKKEEQEQEVVLSRPSSSATTTVVVANGDHLDCPEALSCELYQLSQCALLLLRKRTVSAKPHSPNHVEVIQQLHDFSKTLKRPVKTSTMDANTPPSEWRLIMNRAFLSCSSISPTTVPLSSSISEGYRGRKEHIKTENPVYRASSAYYSIRIKQGRRQNGYRKGTREILLGAKDGGSGVEYSTKGPRTFRRFFFWAVVYLSRDLEVWKSKRQAIIAGTKHLKRRGELLSLKVPYGPTPTIWETDLSGKGAPKKVWYQPRLGAALSDELSVDRLASRLLVTTQTS